MERQTVEQLVIAAMERCNLGRAPEDQLEVGPEAPIFGRGSKLDSLGLVALLFDIEDELRNEGWEGTLSDERAMSQARSPFRNVRSLVEYIMTPADANS
jgi:acyl carrier protein